MEGINQRTIVLVTGANTGLDFEMVRSLCSSGNAYEVLVGGRSITKAQQAAIVAAKEFPSTRSKVWPIQVDIKNDESIQAAFDEVQAKFGRLDALVNNAGTNIV